MPKYTMHVGNVEVTAVSDGELFLQQSFYPDVPAQAWGEYPEQLDAEGRVLMNLGSFVIRSGGKTILVDTGLGPVSHGMTADTGSLPASMRERGVPPDEIDAVVLTHLHWDHVGWNVVGEGADQRLGFPNARYLVSKVDWDMQVELIKQTPTGTAEELATFERRISAFREQVQPLDELNAMDLFEREYQITPEVTTMPSPGHTPGHMSVVISSQGERAMVLGDCIHMPLEVHETDWVCRGDRDPALTMRTRRALLDAAEQDGTMLFGGHFPAPGFGKLVRSAGRRYWVAV
jgi:glyoxylase-like metal-dependent hydrolase (beta-lactamase superfamily II)